MKKKKTIGQKSRWAVLDRIYVFFTSFNEPSVGGTDQLQIFTHKKAYYTMHYGFESSELRWMSTVLVQKGQHLLPQCRTKQDLDR